MSGTLNKVMLIGNLGGDPQIHTFNNGDKQAKFSLATTETWKDKGISNYNQLTTSHFNFPSVASSSSATKGQGLSRLNAHQRPNRGFNPAHKWKQKQSKSEHAL